MLLKRCHDVAVTKGPRTAVAKEALVRTKEELAGRDAWREAMRRQLGAIEARPW